MFNSNDKKCVAADIFEDAGEKIAALLYSDMKSRSHFLLIKRFKGREYVFQIDIALHSEIFCNVVIKFFKPKNNANYVCLISALGESAFGEFPTIGSIPAPINKRYISDGVLLVNLINLESNAIICSNTHPVRKIFYIDNIIVADDIVMLVDLETCNVFKLQITTKEISIINLGVINIRPIQFSILLYAQYLGEIIDKNGKGFKQIVMLVVFNNQLKYFIIGFCFDNTPYFYKSFEHTIFIDSQHINKLEILNFPPTVNDLLAYKLKGDNGVFLCHVVNEAPDRCVLELLDKYTLKSKSEKILAMHVTEKKELVIVDSSGDVLLHNIDCFINFSKTTFCDLPPDPVTKILELVAINDPGSIGAIRRVCRKWNELTLSAINSSHILHQHFDLLGEAVIDRSIDYITGKLVDYKNCYFYLYNNILFFVEIYRYPGPKLGIHFVCRLKITYFNYYYNGNETNGKNYTMTGGQELISQTSKDELEADVSEVYIVDGYLIIEHNKVTNPLVIEVYQIIIKEDHSPKLSDVMTYHFDADNYWRFLEKSYHISEKILVISFIDKINHAFYFRIIDLNSQPRIMANKNILYFSEVKINATAKIERIKFIEISQSLLTISLLWSYKLEASSSVFEMSELQILITANTVIFNNLQLKKSDKFIPSKFLNFGCQPGCPYPVRSRIYSPMNDFWQFSSMYRHKCACKKFKKEKVLLYGNTFTLSTELEIHAQCDGPIYYLFNQYGEIPVKLIVIKFAKRSPNIYIQMFGCKKSGHCGLRTVPQQIAAALPQQQMQLQQMQAPPMQQQQQQQQQATPPPNKRQKIA